MTWIRPISAQLEDPPELLGSKAHGLVALHRLGLPVPDAFVVTTEACREFLSAGRLPDGLMEEVATAVAGLESATGRTSEDRRRRWPCPSGPGPPRRCPG